LAIDLPPSFLIERTNINQEILINLTYPNANPDKLFYSCALIYDFNVVATIVMKFLTFRIKLWDHFMKYEDTDNIVIRMSVYDPRYFMPSTTAIKFILNLPTKSCRFKINKVSGMDLGTEFTLAVNDCQDDH